MYNTKVSEKYPLEEEFYQKGNDNSSVVVCGTIKLENHQYLSGTKR